MSKTIDERVVSMQFDNQNFERNVSNTMSTLDKLKQKLSFSGATKGLDNIDSAARNINFSPLGNAVQTVHAKFSALEVMGVTALANITNSAVNAGKRIASALTIDPIKTGFQEYETQINAVQTILANTSHAGTDINDVNKALDELNLYADKTIYNFTEMTRNIGTFTAAGLGLEESTAAIKGIANLAAVSGSTSHQASTAMYQLSQALANGKVNLQDWNSVVNAGMGGKVFQDALVRTAAAMKGVTEETFRAQNITGSFRESISSRDGGGWLTADVLSKTLQQFTGDMSDAELAAQGFTTEQIKNIQAMGVTANDAATKVKTMTQLWDTLKESAQSGWSQTWKTVVGDYEEAKELWTMVSDTVGEMINNSAESRNSLISGALDTNWEKMVKQINEAGIESTTFEEKLRETMESHKLDVDKLIEEHGSLTNVFRSGAVSSDILKEAVDSLSGSMVDLTGIERDLKKGLSGDDVKKAQEALKNLDYDLGKFGADGKFGSVTEAAVKAFQEANELEVTGIIDDKTLKALDEASNKTVNLSKDVDELISSITELGGREIAIEGLKNIFNGLLTFIKPVKEAFREIFPPMQAEQLLNIIKRFRDLSENFGLSEGQALKLKNTFKGLFSVLKVVVTAIKALASGAFDLLGNITGLGDGILTATGSFGEWLSKMSEGITEADYFGKAIDGIVGFLKNAIDAVREFFGHMNEKFVTPGFSGFLDLMLAIWEVVKDVAGIIGKLGTSLGTALANIFTFDNIDNGLDILNGGLLTIILLNIKKFIGGLADHFKSGGGVLDSLKDMLDGVKDTFDGVRESLTAWQNNLRADTLMKLAGAVAILAAAIIVISMIDPVTLTKSLGAITTLFAELMGAMALFTKISGAGIKGAVKATAMMTGLSISVLILAAALKTISTIDGDKMLGSLAGIIALTFTMVAAMTAMSMTGTKGAKGALGMVLFAAAIKVLASACVDLSTLNWSELAKGLAGVGILLAEVSLFLNTAKFSGKAITTATGIVILAGALHLLVPVCEAFGNMDVKNLVQGVTAIGAILGIIAIFTNLSGNAKRVVSTALSLLVISGAMKIFASVVNELGAMSVGEIARGLLAMAGSLLAVTVAMNLLPKDVISKSVGLVIVAGALTVLADVLKNMGGMSWGEIARGLITLGVSLGIVALGLLAMKNSLAGSAALLVAAAALSIFVPILDSLGSMPIGTIIQGLLSLVAVFVILGTASAVLGPMIPAMLGVSAAVLVFGVGCLAAGAGIAALALGITALATSLGAGAAAIVSAVVMIITGIASTIPVIIQRLGEGIILLCEVITQGAPAIGEAIKALVLTLVDVLVECIPAITNGALKLILSVLTGLAEYTPQIVTVLFNFLIEVINAIADRLPDLIQAGVNLVMALFTGIVDALKGIDPSALLEGILAVGLLAGLMYALAGVAALTPAAMLGVLGVGAVLTELIFVLAAIGGIAQIPGLEWLITEGGDFLEKVGTAIGQFIGGIAGGIAKGFSSSLPDIGKNLSEFMIELQPFIDGLRTINPSILESAAVLAATIIAITAADIVDGLASFITGGSSIADFGAQLAELGPHLAAFSQSVSTVNPAAIHMAAQAIKMLADVASSLPNEGGWAAAILGDNSIADFGAKLPQLGTDLNGFITNLGTFTEAQVTTVSCACSAIKALADAATAIPDEGGWAAKLFGDNSLASFGSALPQLGTDLSGFITNLGTFTEAQVTTASCAGLAIKALADAATAIPDEGGWAAKIFGENSLATFGSKLPQLGTDLNGFVTNLGTFTEDQVNTVSFAGRAIKALAEAANLIPKEGGWAAAILGDNSLATFGSKLPQLGTDLNGFVTNLGTFTEEQSMTISCAGKAIATLAEAAFGIDGQAGWAACLFGDNSIATFGSKLPQLGSDLNGFVTNLGTFTEEQVTTASCAGNAIKALADAASSINGQPEWAAAIFGDNSIATFGGQLPQLGTDLNGFVTNLGTFTEEQVNTVSCAGRAITALAEAANLIPGEGGWVEKILGDNSLATFGGQLPELGSNLSGFVTNLGTFTEDQVATVTCAGDAIKTLASAASSIDAQPDWAKAIFGDNGLAAFGTELGSLGSDISTFAENLGTFDEAKVNTVRSAVKAIEALTGLAGADLSGAKKHLEGFGSKLGTLGSDIASFCGNMPSGESIDLAVSNVKAVIALISDVAAANATALVDFTTSLKSLGSDGLSAFLKAFAGADAKNKAKTAGADLMGKVVDGVESKQGKVKTAFEDSAKLGVEGIKGKYDSFYSAGSYLVDGFAAGISENSYKAAAKAAAMASAAYEAARKELDVNSPSKVFRSLGYTVPEGFAMGIDRLAGMAKDSTASMADTAINGVKKSISRISDYMNGDIDSQPTIRPVLDLSDVRSGAGEIGSMLSAGSSVGVLANINGINSMMNQRIQNGSNAEVVSAIDKLRRDLGKVGNTSYNFGNITYDDGSAIADAVGSLVRAARMERRV